MFAGASAFNQDISYWAVNSITSMYDMFAGASAFDQDLGWCVDDDVNLGSAFDDTQCASTSCGVKHVDGACAPSPAPTMSFAPSAPPTMPPSTTPVVPVVDAATPARGPMGLAALVLALFLSF